MTTAAQTAQAVVTGDTRDAVNEMKKLGGAVKEAEGAMGRGASAGANMGKGLFSLENAGKLATKALGAAGLALGVREAVLKLDELLERSSKVKNVFNNLTINLDAAKQSTMGMVDGMTLATAANNAVRLGVVQTGDEFANLAEAGAKLALSTGQDATKGVEDLTTALARGSAPILDNLGITLKVEDAHRLYAQRLGKTVDQLTEAEKAQAFRTIGMEKALQAAQLVEIAEDDLGNAYIRQKTAVTDATDALLGANDLAGKVREAYVHMTPEILRATETMHVHGAAAQDVERFLMSQGVAVKDLAQAFAILRTEMKRATQAAAASDVAAIDQFGAAIEKQIRDTVKARETEIRELEILGRSKGGEAFAKEAERLRQLGEDELIALESAKGDFEAASKLQDEARLRRLEKMVSEEEKLSNRRVKKKKDEIEELLKAAKMENTEGLQPELNSVLYEEEEARIQQLDREIERTEALGLETEFMMRRRAELAVELQEQLGNFDEADQIRHEEEIRRMRERTKIQEAAAKDAKRRAEEAAKLEKKLAAEQEARLDGGARNFAAAIIGASEAAGRATENRRQAFARFLKDVAWAHGKELAILSLAHFAKAAVAAVSLNPVKAASEAAAGGLAAAKAALFLSGGIIAKGFGSGGGGRGEGSGGRGGIPSGLPPPNPAPSPQSAPAEDAVPLSLDRSGSAAGVTTATKGPTVVIEKMQVLGAPDEDTAVKFARAIARLQRRVT